MLNALVGKNSSGKSNVLRALNLFFNGQLESGKPLVFGRDFHVTGAAAKKKKRIAVTVDFELPRHFKLRKELAGLAQLGQTFSITRTWELDQRRRVFDYLSGAVAGRPVPNSGELARQFLSLVSFRYIPNRSIPADLLKDESQAIADSIFLRMKGDQHSAGLMAALNKAAGRMLQDAGDSMQAAGSPLGSPRIALADSLGEMLRMSGFRAKSPTGESIQDEDWGAGHQAFFLYLVLHALDTNYGRFFGWKQATVWGVEEPESALHRDLETRLAEKLRNWSMDETSRLQILVTTHSPIFVMASDTGYWAELRAGETVVEPLSISRLSRAAEARGVSGWIQPVLAFPWNPVVLVEGARDSQVLTHVAELAGAHRLRFLSLPGLDLHEKHGGKDSVISYLRRNQTLIQNRPLEAPLIVLFDWDVSAQDLERARKAYGGAVPLRVSRMSEEHCDPRLGKDFRGIERFFPPELFLSAHDAGEIVLGFAAGKPFSVSASQLETAKGPLLERLLRMDQLEVLAPLVNVLRDIERSIASPIGSQAQLIGESEA